MNRYKALSSLMVALMVALVPMQAKAVELPFAQVMSNLNVRVAEAMAMAQSTDYQTIAKMINEAEVKQDGSLMTAAFNAINRLQNTELAKHLERRHNSVALPLAEKAVAKAEKTRDPGDVASARQMTDNMFASSTRTSLANRLNELNTTVSLEVDISAVERTALTTQGAIDAVTVALGQLDKRVEAYPDKQMAAGYKARLDKVRAKLPAAQASVKITAVKAQFESIKTQTELDAAKKEWDKTSAMVNALTDATAKTPLRAELDGIYQRYNYFSAKVQVVSLETQLENSEKLTSVDTLRNLHTKAAASVKLLTSEADRNELTKRLDTALVKIDLLDVLLKVKRAEDLSANLTTLTQVDQAQTAYNTAAKLVSAMTTDLTRRTEYSNRLIVVADKISYMRIDLKVQLAEQKARTLDTEANVTSALSAYTDALKAVNADMSARKYSWQARLEAIRIPLYIAQAQVKVEASIRAADAINSTTAVFSAQSAHDTAFGLVSELPNSLNKTNLFARLDVAQTKIDRANARLLVDEAEKRVELASVSTAQKAVNKLPYDAEREQLQKRLDQALRVAQAANLVDIAQSNYSALNIALLNANLMSASHRSNVRAKMTSATTSWDRAKDDLLAVITPESPQVVRTRVAEQQARLERIKTADLVRVAGAIVSEADTDYHSAPTPNAPQVVRGTPVFLMTDNQSQISFTLRSTTDLRWVSVDDKIATVNQQGRVTALKSGVAKIVVYNEVGYLSFYLIFTEPAK